MKFILALIATALTASASQLATNFSSGSFFASGAITQTFGFTNVSNAVKYMVEIFATPSGTVSGASASLQGSNDCVNFGNLPIKTSGDATKSVTFAPSAGISGVYFLGETDVSVNCIQVAYGIQSGTINIQQNTSLRSNMLND